VQRNLVLELDIPSSAEYIAIVRLVVASVAGARRALADERVDDLKLAVSEACTNAIEANHSASPTSPTSPTSPVHVEVWESPDRLEVCIEDSGPGFDPDKVASPPPFTDPERLNFERGLGIPLIRTLVDNAAFVRKRNGTLVRMTVFGGPVDGDDTGTIYMDVSRLSDPPSLDSGG
jgi:serine/threonine-protein kinase RsbW